MQRIFLTCLIILLQNNALLYAQNPYVDSLLTVISGLQKPVADTTYQAGIFPSQRCYLSGKFNAKEDDNIFFTGLIIWTLKSIQPMLTPHNRQKVDRISAKAVENYHRYRNKDGGPAFNFWQTNPSKHFPNSRYFSTRKKYILPDDLDDTAILYLSADFSDSLKQAVKLLIAENANGNKKTVKNTYKKYKHRKAYSTWFGKNMPVDFDICVQANGLRFVLDNGFKLDTYDSATIKLISDMVLSGRHLKNPHYVSPHYQDAAIILYHLARLVAAHPEQKELYALKPQLLKDIQQQMLTNKKSMRQVLLCTSLLRLGETVSEKIAVSEKDMDAFYFFVANMTSVFPNPVKGIFANSRKTNFFYRCEAYYLTLLLENEIYRVTSNQ